MVRLKNITREMLKIYQPVSNLDWLNYKIVRKGDMTFHHIIKREHGGKETMENGALLLPIAHQYLHLIECKENDIYVALNKLFKMVNEQQHEPTYEQRQFVEYLLKEFESTHKWDKGAKGKLLLRRKYLERGL